MTMGCRQAVRHQTLTLTVRGFESYHPSQNEKVPTQVGAFSFCANSWDLSDPSST